MKRLARTLGLLLAMQAGGLAGAVRAADNSPIIVLPPMLVEESINSVPWLYVNVEGCEVLSRCSAFTTSDLVYKWLTSLRLLHALVPEEFLARTDVPSLFVLYSQDLQQTVNAEIQRELQAVPKGDGRTRDPPGGSNVNIAPSMRLADRDMSASIAYIDEARFNGADLSIAPSHVRYLLESHVPRMPAWLAEGVERIWRHADLEMEPITVQPLFWPGPGESEAFIYDPSRPRALLPASELFASDGERAVEERNFRRVQTRSAQQELFFRWAMTTSEATRAALWKFAARAAAAPVTEEMFEACFGFAFAELRDQLSDYLPAAVADEAWIDPGNLPSVPRFEVTPATPNQIARLRGEWERLAIGYVQRRMPQVREPYIAQARRTLRKTYNTGDRDPRLLATIGLCEIDAGNPAGAREFLEAAAAGGVVRPRAYYELARLRFADLRRDAPETKQFSFSELAPVFQPLRQAMKQAPQLPDVFALLAEAWARCEIPPRAGDFAELAAGARLFGRNPAAAYPIARVFARHGKSAEAAALLDACSADVTDENTRANIAQLRAELPVAPVRSPADS